LLQLYVFRCRGYVSKILYYAVMRRKLLAKLIT